MANHELFSTQNLNCEVTTSDVSFDFGDTSRFRKIEFPEQAGITANALLQLVPAQLVADTASNLYVLHFPKGIQGTLMNLHQGGQSTTMIDVAGSFAGSASLYKVNPTAVAAFQMFSVASFATGQYFLADISSKLTEVNRKLDDLLAFLQASKRTELLSELTFVKYALANYATIMFSEPQRMATIGNLQRAKIKAVADIDFTQSSWRVLLLQSPTKIKQKLYCRTNKELISPRSFTPSARSWKRIIRKTGTNPILQISARMQSLCLH